MSHLSRLTLLKNLSSGKELNALLVDAHRVTAKNIVEGRNLTAGYTRGGGINFCGLDLLVEQDPVFKESMELVMRNVLAPKKVLINLFLIMKYGMEGLSGDFIEFGSYRGGSALFMAVVARRLGLTGTIYALDTFEGIPEADDLLDFYTTGELADTYFKELSAYVKESRIDNLVLVKGPFETTAPDVLKKMQPCVLAHIDSRTYSSVKYALSLICPKMHPEGGYLAMHDPLQSLCLGPFQAIEELVEECDLRAEQVYPHLVYRWPKLIP